jgi:hypothetical protein
MSGNIFLCHSRVLSKAEHKDLQNHSETRVFSMLSHDMPLPMVLRNCNTLQKPKVFFHQIPHTFKFASMQPTKQSGKVDALNLNGSEPGMIESIARREVPQASIHANRRFRFKSFFPVAVSTIGLVVLLGSMKNTRTLSEVLLANRDIDKTIAKSYTENHVIYSVEQGSIENNLTQTGALFTPNGRRKERTRSGPNNKPPQKYRRDRQGQRMKISGPVLIMSLPKSGTTSLQKYFQCGLATREASAHYWSYDFQDQIGKCMESNLKENIPVLTGCGIKNATTAFSDFGLVRQKNKGQGCFYPGFSDEFWNNLAAYYPNATIVLGTRGAESWHKSAEKWASGSLIYRWRRHCDNFPGMNGTAADFAAFYRRYSDMVKTRAAKHNLRYVHVALEDPETPLRLHEQIGFRVDCFKVCRPKTGCTGFNPLEH